MSEKSEDTMITIDENKQIKLFSEDHKFYFGDEKKGIVDATVIESEIGTCFIIAELEQVSYEELLQRAFKNAYERNPNYFEEDRITSFLYWHGCKKCGYKIPKTKSKDKEINKKLKSLGYKVLRFWEHEIYQSIQKCMNKVLELKKPCKLFITPKRY